MSDDWKDYQEFVLRELNRLNNNVEKLEEKIDIISTDIAVLKIKAGLWGLIGGALPILIALAIYFLSGII